MRSQTNLIVTFPPALHPSRSLPHPPKWHRGTGIWFLVSSSHIFAAAAQGEELESLPCSSMGSLPRETVLQELLQLESIPQGTALHRLLPHGSHILRVSPSGPPAPAWVPYRLTRPCSKPASACKPPPCTALWACQDLAQQGLPTGSKPLSGIPCSSI